MNIIHKTVKLRHGTLIRVVGEQCDSFPSIYQYTVDMLFKDNNWQRIYVSRLFEDPWRMLLIITKFIETSRGNFKVKYLTERAREKYGKEIKVRPSLRSQEGSRDTWTRVKD